MPTKVGFKLLTQLLFLSHEGRKIFLFFLFNSFYCSVEYTFFMIPFLKIRARELFFWISCFGNPTKSSIKHPGYWLLNPGHGNMIIKILESLWTQSSLWLFPTVKCAWYTYLSYLQIKIFVYNICTIN